MAATAPTTPQRTSPVPADRPRSAGVRAPPSVLRPSPHAAARDHSVLSRVDPAGGRSLDLTGPTRLADAGAERSRRQAPVLPTHLKQWTAPSYARQPPAKGARRLQDYQPLLDATTLDRHWRMAYHAAGRGGPQQLYKPPPQPPPQPAREADARQLCTPSAIISRHLQSTLRAGFAQHPGVLFDRQAAQAAAQAKLQAAHPVRWRAAPMRVPPRFIRA